MIKVANRQDASFIYASICDLEQATLNPKHFHEGYEQQLNNADMHYFVLEKGHQKVGFISVRILYHLHHVSNIAMIEELYITKNQRKQGYGKELLRFAALVAQRNGCAQLELSSRDKRTDAHAFYAACGLKQEHLKFSASPQQLIHKP